MMRPLARLLGAAGLIAAFALVLRTSASRAADRAGLPDCERATAHDPAALERCLLLDPNDIETMIALARWSDESGAGDRAERLYRRALSVDPKDALVHLELGRLLQRRGDVEGARQEGRRALEIRPGSLEAGALADGRPDSIAHGSPVTASTRTPNRRDADE